MNQTKIQILSCEQKSGMSKKNGQPWSMFVCQAVTHGAHEDGTPKVLVGELILPRGMPAVQPGMYVGGFEVAVDPQTKRIGGQLVSLEPFIEGTHVVPVRGGKDAAAAQAGARP